MGHDREKAMTSHSEPLSLFLKRLLLRSELDEAEQQAILGLRAHLQEVPAGADIVIPGDCVEYSCLVATGLIGRFEVMSDGQRQIVSLYLSGDMCDLQSVVLPVAGWGLEAISASTVLKVPHADLRRLAADFPSLAMAFWRDTAVDACILAKSATIVRRKDAMCRLAHLICEMTLRSEMVGITREKIAIFEASQARLADILGLTPVHVNRTLADLRKAGAIEGAGRSFAIADWNTLVSIAEFDPIYLVTGTPEERLLDRAG